MSPAVFVYMKSRPGHLDTLHVCACMHVYIRVCVCVCVSCVCVCVCVYIYIYACVCVNGGFSLYEVSPWTS